MKENKSLRRKINFLYGIVFLLMISLICIFILMNKRFDMLRNDIGNSNILSTNIYKKMNKIVELNKLDTENCSYLINNKEFDRILASQTGNLKIDIPENWRLEKTEMRKCIAYSEDKNPSYEFEMYLNMSGTVTFNDFTKIMYDKISAYSEEVLSFNKDKGGYYAINSFSEATYNNMYYDYITYDEDGALSGPRIKIKLLNPEENVVKIEINKF